MSTCERIIGSADEMREVGRRLGVSLLEISAGPVIITLQGELGAGKTTLVRGLLQTFGVVGAVRSPTYTLIEPYESMSRRIYHLDLYRLGNARDLDGLGIRDLLEPDAILLIEWPERAGEAALPTVDLNILISYADMRSAGSDTLAPTQKIIPERAASTREEKAVVAAGAENSCGARRVLLHPVTARGKSLVQSSWPRDK